MEDKTGKAITVLIDKITTNHTYFMREANHFYYLRDKVLPHLSQTVKDNDLRIWSAACSTGEEPYTLAMIIDEYFGRNKMYWDAKILATDISSQALASAQKGSFTVDRIQPLPSTWKINYFTQLQPGVYNINESIKKEVIFRKFNLNERIFPFRKKFHIIFCRNAMIYFGEETKKNLISKFYDSLCTGGYLFIGHSESIDRRYSKFRYVMPSVYQKV